MKTACEHTAGRLPKRAKLSPLLGPILLTAAFSVRKFQGQEVKLRVQRARLAVPPPIDEPSEGHRDEDVGPQPGYPRESVISKSAHVFMRRTPFCSRLIVASRTGLLLL